jgi:hypothetical protein
MNHVSNDQTVPGKPTYPARPSKPGAHHSHAARNPVVEVERPAIDRNGGSTLAFSERRCARSSTLRARTRSPAYATTASSTTPRARPPIVQFRLAALSSATDIVESLTRLCCSALLRPTSSGKYTADFLERGREMIGQPNERLVWLLGCPRTLAFSISGLDLEPILWRSHGVALGK